MGRGRGDRRSGEGAAPRRPRAGAAADDLADRCREEGAFEVVGGLRWEQVTATLAEHPKAADEQVTILTGDYGTEGYETFPRTVSVREVVAEALDLEPDAEWGEMCEALRTAPDPAADVAVMEGDYGWDGWVELPGKRPLSWIVRDALGAELDRLHPLRPAVG